MTYPSYSEFEKKKLEELTKLLDNLQRNPSNGSRHEQAIEDWATTALRESATAYREATRVELRQTDPLIGMRECRIQEIEQGHFATLDSNHGRTETLIEIDQKGEQYMNH